MVKSAALAKPLPCIRTYIQSLYKISDMQCFDNGIYFLSDPSPIIGYACQ